LHNQTNESAIKMLLTELVPIFLSTAVSEEKKLPPEVPFEDLDDIQIYKNYWTTE